MRIFVLHEGQRVTLDVDEFQKVHDIKEIIREAFAIGPDEGASSLDIQEKKILTLNYAGADLNNDWWFADLGIVHGSTIKAILREEIKPSIYVYTAFNGKTVPITDKIPFKTMKASELRGVVSRKVGLPVSVFRLISPAGREMFDTHVIDDYGIELGSRITLGTWDGWSEYLNLCLLGFATQVMQHLSINEAEARFQMKVAMYIAAHYNHTDLAVSMLRNGIKADESIGEHPARMWCKESLGHIDTLRTPCHVASEAGALGVLRSFIHNNVMNVLAKDGNGLTPLNIALRTKNKPCASFLLTKQWSKISYTKKHSIPLSIFVKLRRWGDRAKDKAFIIHGQWKSSLKNPKKNMQPGCLVGMDVQIDGFSTSKQRSLNEIQARQELEEYERRKQRLFDFSADFQPEIDPEVYFKSINSIGHAKYSKYNRFGRSLGKLGKTTAAAEKEKEVLLRDSEEEGDDSDTEHTGTHSPTLRAPKPGSKDAEQMETKSHVRFPPIGEIKHLSQSQHELQQYGRNPEEAGGSKAGRVYNKTPSKQHTARTSRTMPTPVQQTRFLPSLKTEQGDKSTTAAGEPPTSPQSHAKKDPSMKSAVMVAKSRLEGHNIPLPVYSWDTNPRPFVSDKSSGILQTLRSYEKMRGMTSREYAIQCLSVTSGFKEKPWLAQVQQAMSIASRGVKKTVARRPHLFLIPVTETDSRGTTAEG